MHIWLTTTNMRTVQKAVKLGLFSGIVTTPALLADTKRAVEEVLENLLHYQEGPVAVQVATDDSLEIVQQGQTLHSLSNRLIIKVPATKNGLEGIHLLSRQGISTMATAIYHPHQALIAALAGANYVSPHIECLEKAGGDPWSMLKITSRIFEIYRLKTKILATSLSIIDQVMQCAQIGLYGITVNDALFEELIATPPLTLESVATFADDWKQVNTPFI